MRSKTVECSNLMSSQQPWELKCIQLWHSMLRRCWESQSDPRYPLESYSWLWPRCCRISPKPRLCPRAAVSLVCWSQGNVLFCSATFPFCARTPFRSRYHHEYGLVYKYLAPPRSHLPVVCHDAAFLRDFFLHEDGVGLYSWPLSLSLIRTHLAAWACTAWAAACSQYDLAEVYFFASILAHLR